jgi:uncharacterized protein YdeI (YjbR/CyaY-like superfamily)
MERFILMAEKKFDLLVIAFPTQQDWADWLEKNHKDSKGIWLRFYKKNSKIPTVTYDEALDEALCYGWIDGQLQTYDELSYAQRFTPRRARSPWSKRNILKIQKLEKEGRMKPSGSKEVEAAKADGRWERAYDPSSEMEMPADFMAELAKESSALAFFESLNKANKYAIAWRLQTARRPETRDKRMKEILEMMRKGEKLH